MTLKNCPCGYPFPAWELTPNTLSFWAAVGFLYSSKLMDDFIPYIHPQGIVELPVQWVIDEAPYFLSGMTGSAIQKKRQVVLITGAARGIGQPQDAAGVAAFLLSDPAEFITGQVISPNGGAYV
jgi:hypothetical protein